MYFINRHQQGDKVDILVQPKHDPFDCPFRSDLNSCHANHDIGVNGCPITVFNEVTEKYENKAPAKCPLRKGTVTVKLIS